MLRCCCCWKEKEIEQLEYTWLLRFLTIEEICGDEEESFFDSFFFHVLNIDDEF